MATLAPGAYGPPIPTGPTTPQKPFAQQLEENYFAGSKPSQDERAGFRNFLSLVQSSGKSNSQIESDFQKLKNGNFDFAGTLDKGYYQNKLAQQIADQRQNLGTEKYYQGAIGAMGGIDTATQYMADLLTRSGIRDISEIGEKTQRGLAINTEADKNQALTDFANWYNSGGYQGQSANSIVDVNGKQYYYTNASGVDPSKLSGAGKDYWNLATGYGNAEIDSFPVLLPYERIGPEEKVLYNKRTGEQLKQGHDASYIGARTAVQADESGKFPDSYTFGGSFAGGNTNLNISMVNGVPVFSSSPGPSSSDISPNMLAAGVGIASLMFPGVGQAIGSAIAGAVGVAVTPAVAGAIGTFVIQTAVNEGDVEKGLLSAAMAYAGAELFSGQDAAITTGDLQGAAAAGLTPEQVTDFLADPTMGGSISNNLSVGANDALAQLNNIPDLTAKLETGLSDIANLSGNAAFVAADAIEPIFASAGPMPPGLPQGIQGLPSAEAFQSPLYNFPTAATPGFDFQAGQGFPAGDGLQVADPFAMPDVSFVPEYLENPLGLGSAQNLQTAPYVLSPADIDNVVANLGNGTVMVSDSAGNLSVVPADGLDFVDDIDNLAAVSTDVLKPGTPPTGVDAAIGDLGLDDLTLEDLAKDLGGDSVPISREVTLDAELPGAKATGTIDADGVKINRDVTLDPDRPFDAGTKVTEPIDADGVSIKREMLQSDVAPASTSSVGGDQTFTQVYDDGSVLTVDANGNITATDALDVGNAGIGDLTPRGALDDGAATSDAASTSTSTDSSAVSTDSNATVQNFEDGSTLQTFDDGSTLGIDADGNVTATNATDLNVSTNLQDLSAGTSKGTVQTLDDGSTIQTFDDGSTLTTDANGNIVATNATDILGAGTDRGLPKNGGAKIEDRTTLYEEIKDKPLSDSLKDLGEGVLEFATSNPLLTTGVLLGGTALLGGDKTTKEVDPEPPAKKTYTYGAAPERDTSTLTPTFNAASQIYGPQELYKPPTAVAPEDFTREFGALLSGQAPGSQGLGYLAKTLGAPQTVDINKLTPNQLAILQQMVGVA